MISNLDLREIGRWFVSRAPKAPVKLPEFTQAQLTARLAGEHPWAVVAVTDLGCVGLSNGAVWVRSDGSAL
jgi:hypothetical protein